MNTCVCRRELAADETLCQRCRSATHGRLRRVPALYRLLEPELHPAAGAPTYGRVGLVEAPLPVSLRVLTLRGPGGIVGVLEGWWTKMQASRAGSAPVISGTIEDRVRTAAARLAFHLDYIVTWQEGSSLATAIRELDEQALNIVCPADTREHGERLGPCPSETSPGVLCGAVLRYYRDLSPRAVTCPWCAVVYPPDSWADLKEWMDHDRQQEVLLAAG
ncbi:hypothetical protein [Streptomyces sp. NRRL S-241]|uniref:hypothetical protein n=1 Tax=Streptomyces sp. NRRL S-241 TaxID=1463896 RepID=UPI0004BF450B|nr:hypothetical protein [Streptomyces sp. NRRL S-241]